MLYEVITVTANDVTFTGNQADEGGGLYLGRQSSGSPNTLTNVQFLNNFATWDGGGLYNYGLDLTITNALFVGNTSVPDGWGGAIYNDTLGDVTLV